MNRGCKNLIMPSACGAVVLALIVPFSASGQRGGSTGGSGGGDGYTSIGQGAAGLDRNAPGQDSPSPPISNPAVKAKLDHNQNIKDAALLAKLANEVKQELGNGGEYTFSAASLKKSEEMAKVAKRLHDRMKADYTSAPASARVGGATNRSAPKQ